MRLGCFAACGVREFPSFPLKVLGELLIFESVWVESKFIRIKQSILLYGVAYLRDDFKFFYRLKNISSPAPLCEAVSFRAAPPAPLCEAVSFRAAPSAPPSSSHKNATPKILWS